MTTVWTLSFGQNKLFVYYVKNIENFQIGTLKEYMLIQASTKNSLFCNCLPYNSHKDVKKVNVNHLL